MSGTATSSISLNVLGSYSSPSDAPIYLLLVDGVQIGSGTVASYNFVTQSYMASLATGVPHTISIVYTNDKTSGDMLRLSSITVNGSTISSSDPSETYVSSHGTQVGQGEMYYGGQINFVVPASDFPGSSSGTTTTPIPTPTPTPTPTQTPVSAAPVTVTLGSGSDTLALSISEDAYAGDAQFSITIDGVAVGTTQTTTAIHGSGQTQTFDIKGSFGTSTHTVVVNFLNDGYGGSASTDRNLYVTGATINGTGIAGAVLNEYSGGPQSFVFTGNTPIVTVPTSPPVPPPTVTIGTGSDTLALSISEDAYAGDAQFSVTVDGVAVGTTQTTTANHSAGQTQTFDIEGSFGTSQHTVVVNFLNDAYGGSATTDRNLYVTAATINGVSITGATLNETNGGPQSFVFTGNTPTQTPPSTPVTTPTPPATVTIGSGPNTLALSVSEDAYAGDAKFTISIDGVQQGTTQTTTAIHGSGQTQLFDVNGTFAPGVHTVTVNFLNDAYGGGATTDRNLYVTGATLDGKTISNSALNETAGGPQSFTFVEPGSTPTTPVVTPTGPAYYVAVGGSNTGTGDAAHPFSTIQYALSMMEAHSVKVLYLGNGTYSVPSTITLTAADSGDTILAAAGATPVLNGGNATSTILSLAGANNVTISGLSFINTNSSSQGAALVLNGSTGDTISGNVFNNNGESALFGAGSSNNVFTRNTLLNSATSGVEVKDGSNYNVFSNNIINGVGATNVAGGAFFGHGISYDTFTNNLIENTQGSGIAIEDFGAGTNTVNVGNTISNNQILNTSLSASSTDDGAIYLLGRTNNNTMTTVSMNFISNAGNVNLSGHVEGIYLDDNESGVTVTNNIVQGVQSDAVELHGGYNDTFTNNIFNLGSATRTIALIQQPEPDFPATVQPALTNDSFTNNIVISSQSNPYYGYVYFDPQSVHISISNNLYYDPNYAPGGIPMVSPVTDQSPVIGNPNFASASAGNYAIGSGSAASLIGFVPINQALIGPQ